MTDTRTSLATFSDELADATADAGAAVVAVHARPRLPSTGVHWQDGVVVTTDGTIRREEGITVTLPDGRNVPATLAGRDRGTDLAVLRIPPGSMPIARLGEASALRPGNLVLALARLGDDGAGPRVAFGAVSSVGGPWRCWKGGEISRRLQSDLTIYPGFGGGPLVDASGRVHGINSGGLSGALATTIPFETVDRVLKVLLERGYVARAFIGAAMQPVRFSATTSRQLGLDGDGGLIILSVEPDGPSATAGLLVGDIVVRVDGQPVADIRELLGMLSGDVVGRTLQVDVVRGGGLVTVAVVVGERPRRRS